MSFIFSPDWNVKADRKGAGLAAAECATVGGWTTTVYITFHYGGRALRPASHVGPNALSNQ